jgi:uncharacterized membrane protein
MQADVRNALEQRKREYWRKNQRMIAVLMVIGFVVTYVVAYFARDLNFKFFGCMVLCALHESTGPRIRL